MRNFKKKLALPLIGAALSVGSVQVNAAAVATAVVEFENFTASWLSGSRAGSQVDRGDFSSLTYTSTSDVTAGLVANINDALGMSDSSSDGRPMNLFTADGSHSYVEDSFAHLSSNDPGYPGSNFALSDQKEEGSPITGLSYLDENDVEVFVSSPANLGNASYVALESAGDGSATSNNGLNVSMAFVAEVAGELEFSFDLTTYLEAWLSVGTVGPAFSEAQWNVTMYLENLSARQRYEDSLVLAGQGLGQPDFASLGAVEALNFNLGCNTSAFRPSNGIPSNGFMSFDNPDFDPNEPAGPNNPETIFTNCNLTLSDFSVSTSELISGDSYQLTASIFTRADAKVVPAPGVLALMGLGLLGLVGFGRRKA